MNYSSNFFKLISFITVILISFSESSMASQQEVNIHLEESSRDEMAKSAGYGEDKLSNVIITGTLLCQSCFNGQHQIRSWPISGALVSIKCNKIGERAKRSLVKAVTDEFGDFQIDVPSQLHGIPSLDRTCSVNVHRIPKTSDCNPTFTTKLHKLTLISARNGNRVYTAGGIKLLHSSSQPLRLCTNRESSNSV